MNNNKDEIVLFENGELALEVNVSPQLETVWLSSNQMALLYGRDEKTIRKHVNKIFTDGELERESNTQKMRVAGVSQPVAFYNLDVIISVGYRVNSKQGIAFRKWANSILKQYIIQGYAVNANRMNQLGEVIRIMKRTENSLDAKQVLSVIEKYSLALDLLDDYDHQTMKRPDGNKAVYILSYEECRQVIDSMKFSTDSDLFGNEKDDSFKSSVHGTVLRKRASVGTVRPEVSVGQKVNLYVNPNHPDEFYSPADKSAFVRKVFIGVGALCVSVALVLGVVLCMK